MVSDWGHPGTQPRRASGGGQRPLTVTEALELSCKPHDVYFATMKNLTV